MNDYLCRELSKSFLSNINIGDNFFREDLNYPLAKKHTKFSKNTQECIIKDIINGIEYKQISEKYNISTSYISMINSGRRWHNKKLTYPLCKKNCADGSWSAEAKRLLIFTNLPHSEIGNRLNKAKATITALNVGRNRKDNRFIYPLRNNQEKNKKIWNTLF